MNLGTVNGPSVTKPNPENWRTAHQSVLMTAELQCTILTQNSSDNLLSYFRQTS